VFGICTASPTSAKQGNYQSARCLPFNSVLFEQVPVVTTIMICWIGIAEGMGVGVGLSILILVLYTAFPNFSILGKFSTFLYPGCFK
jgi:hypothetical protein